MKLHFLGAAGGSVTGSCYLIETSAARVMVDCGQFQGGKQLERMNRMPAGFRATKLDAILLTHAHLDHCGRLPLVVKAGFDRTIHATPAAIELAGLILRDAAKIQAHDTERTNRKRQRAGLPPVPPLFSATDVEDVMRLFRPVAYRDPVEVAPGVRARFFEAGHMLGSTSIEVTVTEGSTSRRIVFSGDVGPRGLPLLRDAECLAGADFLVMESTYGDRDHRPLAETLDEFRAILREAVEKRCRMLVPAFAVGRTQQILYHLLEMFSAGEVAPFPVYVDSPMANEATRIYEHHTELFDDEAHKLGLVLKGRGDLWRMIHQTATPDESKALNQLPGPCLIMAGAGMCNAGRILHHLRHGLWQPDTHVLIVGFQAYGTLGRMLVDGRKQVKIFGEPIAVKAKVHTLNGFSAHAGQSELLKWYGCLAESHPRVFLTHGENKPRNALAALLGSHHGIDPALPGMGEVVEL